MKLEFPSIVDYGLDRAAEVLTRAFADYFVSIVFDAGTLLQATRVDSVELASSCIFVRDETAVGGALIARRGWTSRLAGMAILPEARRGGLGRAAVNHLLAEAKARKDRRMVLEVIEQNTVAVNLYRAAGFREIRRLIGFAGPPLDVVSEGAAQTNGNIASDLVEVDLREVAEAVTRYGLPDLPWQLSGETIAQLTPPNAAYRLNGAWIALTNPTTPTVTVRALIADKSLPTPSREATVLRAIMARHPGRKEWRFSPVWPEEHDVMGINCVDGQTGDGQPVSKRARANQLTDIISPVGLSSSPLTQWQMEREI